MKIFYFNPEQESHLQQLAAQVGRDLLQLDFPDPAQDAQTIRRHAYLKGKFELLNELVADSFPDPQPTGE